MSDGVPLAVSAARKAVAEAGIALEEIVSFSSTPLSSLSATRCDDAAQLRLDDT